MSWITGFGITPFGVFPQLTSLDLMSTAAQSAMDCAQLKRNDIDGLLCGYSGTLPHLMLANVFAEHFGLQPKYAHAIQIGGATGLAMVMSAHRLVQAGAADNILVVAGENRASGQTRDASVQMLAGVGHPRYEVPLGTVIPGYYALLASRYLYDNKLREEDLACLAVLMRQHATEHDGAHFNTLLGIEDVMASKPIASPLKMLDCCPISDGGGAVIVSRHRHGPHALQISGAGQANQHQHISCAQSLSHFGARESSETALRQASLSLEDIQYAGIYDSFTVTLALLLEEIGFCPQGMASEYVRNGYFAREGVLPLNTHGGLLSYGHCGVAGVLGHLVETCKQMLGAAENRQIPNRPGSALVHADGGVMSSHVTLILQN